MKVKIKKLWMGHVSVRDHVVRKCKDIGEDLVIECQGDTKVFPHSSLEVYLTEPHMTTCKSKFDGKEYTLIDFPWR